MGFAISQHTFPSIASEGKAYWLVRFDKRQGSALVQLRCEPAGKMIFQALMKEDSSGEFNLPGLNLEDFEISWKAYLGE